MGTVSEKLGKEISDVANKVSESLADGKISKIETIGIIKEGVEVLLVGFSYKKLKEELGADKEAALANFKAGLDLTNDLVEAVVESIITLLFTFINFDNEPT